MTQHRHDITPTPRSSPFRLIRRIRHIVIVLLILHGTMGVTNAWDVKFRKLLAEQHGAAADSSTLFPKDDAPDATCPSTGNEGETFMETFLARLECILWYKPPVGIVTVAAALRLLLTGRIWSVYASGVSSPSAADGVLQQTKSYRQGQKRMASWDLDADDRSYELHGGIEDVRAKLCQIVLSNMENVGSEAEQALIEAALDALYTSCPPGGSRGALVEQMSEPLAILSPILAMTGGDGRQSLPFMDAMFRGGGGNSNPDESMKFLELSAKTAEVRALDALLRQSRDGLLVTCSRLLRLQNHWAQRVAMRRWTLYRYIPKPVAKLFKSSLRGDRVRLSMARAASQMELTRLGRIQQVLMARPKQTMGEDLLLKAVRNTGSGTTNATKTVDQNDRNLGIPFMSRFALRWNADGKKWLSIGVYDGQISMSGEGAREVLLEHGNNAEWIREAQSWTRKARSVLCDTVKETLKQSSSHEQHQHNTLNDLEILEGWGQYDPQTCNQQTCWTSVLELVDHVVTSHRRMGESRAFGLNDVLFLNWFQRLDVFGIPSSVVAIWMASMLHDKVAPRWPEIKAAVVSAYQVAWGIFSRRFWEPLMAILSDLMNKSPKLLDSFDLDVEESSLDHMLKDLGVGDGRPESRKEALQGAAALYEQNLRDGAMVNLLRGRLVRLMLVQIQQLKAGLLKAMGSIDVLVDSNRLNVQLLAAIPAFLLIAVGSKLFIGLLVGYRTKRYMRPVTSIYKEMTEFLYKMETCLLLSSNEQKALVQPSELGEFALYMHSYLVLLDYLSPPFPSRSCDSIHISLQDLLSSQREAGDDEGVAVGTDLALLRLIKEKNKELQKHL